MKKLGYGLLALFIVLIGINKFVRVTPNDDGIILFWLSQKLSRTDASGIRTEARQSSRWSEQERIEILGHMTLSIENSLAAEEILRSKLNEGQQVTSEDTHFMVEKLNYAISEAFLVSDQALQKVHPDLPLQFRKKYQVGIEAIARGLSDKDKKEVDRGAALYGEFKDWGMEHQSEFEYPPK